MSDSGRISPTAHYTGYVWARNGLSHPELCSIEGRALFEALRPLLMLSHALGGASLENYLLARHLAIDQLLDQAIEEHGITQVIEVACGLSPRGWRFSQRYGDRITYVAADLPEMAARKRNALERMGSLSATHRVEEGSMHSGMTVRTASVPWRASCAATAEWPSSPRAFSATCPAITCKVSGTASRARWETSRAGSYISDLHVGDAQTAQVRAFRVLLSAFVRGRVFLHWGDARQAREALRAAGFESACVHRAATLAPEAQGPGAGMAHMIEASTA